MLHTIMPNQISGPNNAVARIKASQMADLYDFSVVTQNFHAGGKINLSLIRDLRTQIKTADPQLIHLTGLQASGFHAICAARLATRAPVLVTIRGFSGDALVSTSLQRAVLTYIFEPLTLALSTRFLTVTRSAGRRRIVRIFRRKYLGALHNAAPAWTAPNLSEAERSERRHSLGLPSGFIATVTGRVVLDKGILTVVEVAARLPAGMTICVVGDGPMLEDLRRDNADLIHSGRLVLMGSREDVREILIASDAFLFATLHENLSNALLEAMTVGLPTVVTSVGGNPEVVVEGETGYLVSPGDSTTMLRHLVELADDPGLRRRLGAAGRERVVANFSQEHLYRELSSVYAQLLDQDPE